METPYSDDQVSNVKYTVLYAIGQEFINHIEEFRYLCPKSLPTEKVESFYEIKMNLFISYYALIYKEDMTFEIIYNIKHPDFIKNLVNSTYLFSRSNKSLYDTVLEILEAIFGKDDKRMINFKKTLKEETDRYKE